jgi:site-specific DNA-methyltransferase (adenine-specific)
MYFETELGAIYNGNCLDVLKDLPDNSITSIITDPPYALEFMGKGWDKVLPSVDIWQECLRVIKPGGILLAFGGTRTYHRLTCSIEDAGWTIRDCIIWVYGSGFPKSTNISKQLDKKLGAEKISKQFDGYGTALKPAYEPIVMAMKQIDGTFANNALVHGVAGINVDESRVPVDKTVDKSQLRTLNRSKRTEDINNQSWGMTKSKSDKPQVVKPEGRFPANLIHDGSEEVVSLFPERKTTWVSKKHKNNRNSEFLGSMKHPGQQGFNDSGSAARFFYQAKASKSERNAGCDNNHPTVKPLSLIKYLVTMVAPPQNAIILDPFLGSGTTAVACEQLNLNWIGIEMIEEYCNISKHRAINVSGKKDSLNTFFE